jgi:hypothetical protein
METDSVVLKHWGILGQKWGVRRYQYPDGRLTDEGKKRYRTGKHLSDFSNDELESYVSRAKKEAELVNTLRNIKDPTVSFGQQLVQSMMKQYGDTFAKDLGKSSAGRLDDWFEDNFVTSSDKSQGRGKKKGGGGGEKKDGDWVESHADDLRDYADDGRLIILPDPKKEKKG